MKCAARHFVLTLFCTVAIAQTSSSYPSALKNVVVIVQENRTPDNLFHFLSPQCAISSGATGLDACTPSEMVAGCYLISTCGLSNQSGTPTPVILTGVAMKSSIDPSHTHTDFVNMCDPASAGVCQMDGAWHTSKNSYAYVKNPTVTNYDGSSGHLLDPYLTFAKSYGWANFMYQTNQGPSYTSHQFLFSGTSALSTEADSNATFVSENLGKNAGCLTPNGKTGYILQPTPPTAGSTVGACLASSTCNCFFNNTVSECQVSNKLNGPVGTFCVQPAPTGHQSMADLLDAAGLSWKYYAPSPGSIWTAPDAFKNICQPALSNGNLSCKGTEWNSHVDVANLGTDILKDIAHCKLSRVSWVIPNGTWSDHASKTNVYGPSWVAAIVNAIGTTKCKDSNGNTLWQDTAIIITWDDWGGWSDFAAPPILSPKPSCTSTNCPGDFQYGFRVPLIVVSAWTPSGYISNYTHDFGSILRTIEGLNRLGNLGFADSRATTDLSNFFTLTTPREYTRVKALKTAKFFLNQAASGVAASAPDND